MSWEDLRGYIACVFKESPFTGRPILHEKRGESCWKFQEAAGWWAASNEALDSWLTNEPDVQPPTLQARKNVDRARAVARTLLVQGRGSSGTSALFLKDRTDRIVKDQRLEGYNNWTFDELVAQADDCDFKTRALRTLANLVNQERSPGAGIFAYYSQNPYPGTFWNEELPGYISLHEIAHHSVDSEIPVVMQFLIESGSLRVFPAEFGSQVLVTPDGYLEADRLSHGKSATSHSAFLVCRFTQSMDELFFNLYGSLDLGSNISCPITRVIDVAHNDRIDDRILKMIRMSSVVVVDLTDHNFNIGFEAGYALSLGKPIVWTCEELGCEQKLPFDIQSQNVLFYKRGELDKMREQLKYRMIAALDHIRASR
ncbi:MAG: nucleoside 2-deoxyribosyltransferase [Fimbriimonadaceae bacterium]|nr:nucleoside 2-deoxyribosyltransferase [Fimbriimonadaceae bacterium]